MELKLIDGGICAPKGFKANGIHCGIRKNRTKRDLCLIISENRCAAAAVYTKNLVQGAPIAVTKANIKDGYAQALICNSGNANTCNADGIEIAEGMCVLVEQHTEISADDVIVASTGVIGQPLSLTPISNGMEFLAAGLGDYSDLASEAILTTDTKKKEIAASFLLGGKECRIAGIAKGSGMIHPNMATMLCFLTTDASISPKMLQCALSSDTESSFNMVSVDGDTSTNDMASIMASGLAGNKMIVSEGADYTAFCEALSVVTTALSRMIAGDGEGATKLIECHVEGGKDLAFAQKAAKAVISSSLVKAAMFGADANWGRVLCALGYSEAVEDINAVEVRFRSAAGEIQVAVDGHGIDFSEETAKKILCEAEIEILVTLKDGTASATAWGCDLTYDYVKINGDYRT